ncbi:MAG: hypothetical protein ACP5IV_07275 [Caldisericia bacterium]
MIRPINLFGIILMIPFVLFNLIPQFFASRIIFYLKPLLLIIPENYKILFIICWFIINFLLLLFILKKINISWKDDLGKGIILLPIVINYSYLLPMNSAFVIQFLLFSFYGAYLMLKKIP